MPELPDIVAYQEAIKRAAETQSLISLRVYRPFLVRTFDPPPAEAIGKTLTGVERIGKRLMLVFQEEIFLVIHLMIAGRLLWLQEPPVRPAKTDLAVFQFESGTLLLTEAGTKRRTSLHAFSNRDSALALDRGGIDPLVSSAVEFAAGVVRDNRTLKRILTNPRTFSGIGNAYSDEILFEAKLSPVKLSQTLDDDEIRRLYDATRSTLERWIQQLRAEFQGRFPGRGEITAFRDEFFVHGRFGKPCRVCGLPIQRIVYAENEANYCARCQNEGRVLADRALSRLLKEDWPKTLEELVGD